MKLKVILLTTLLSLPPSMALAQSTASEVINGYLTTAGCPGIQTVCFRQSDQLTPVSGSQGGLTLAASTSLTVPTGATKAQVVVEVNSTYSAAVRCWADGTVPTPTTGFEIQPGGTWWIYSDLTQIKCVQEASSAAIDVGYYK